MKTSRPSTTRIEVPDSEVRVMEIDFPTEDFHSGSILRRDPRRDPDGDSRSRATPNGIDEEPASSNHAHLGRAQDHFRPCSLDHLTKLADDDLAPSEQQEFAVGPGVDRGATEAMSLDTFLSRSSSVARSSSRRRSVNSLRATVR